MADNETETETETKKKRTVPALERTARGVASHAAAVLEMQWDKERKSFKDPITASMALFTYAKLTAALLDETEARLTARATALEVRVEQLEQQLADFESWRADITKTAEAAQQQFAEMMSGGDPMAKLKEIVDSQSASSVLPPSAPPVVDTPVLDMVAPPIASTVVPFKSEATEKKREKPAEKNGGAA